MEKITSRQQNTMPRKDGEAPKLHLENAYRNFWNPWLAAGGCWWLLVAAAADPADAEGSEVLAGGSETAKHHRPKGRNDF